MIELSDTARAAIAFFELMLFCAAIIAGGQYLKGRRSMRQLIERLKAENDRAASLRTTAIEVVDHRGPPTIPTVTVTMPVYVAAELRLFEQIHSLGYMPVDPRRRASA